MNMMKNIFALTLLGLCSGTAFSGTAINCYEVADMDQQSIEVCVEQTNRHLNENYSQLQETFQDNEGTLALLKDMQLAWIKMRDAQCEINSRHTGGNSGLVGLTCEVILTQKRADDLEKMNDGDFASF
jgi:uncharacterized protein YecT (DUF1311 family)